MASAVTLFVGQPASALTGPDVSSWQHASGTGINWAQVHAAGNSFAFVKATEGPSGYYLNPYFVSDWANVRAAGLIRGAYHFARPEFSAVDQANYFVSIVGNTSAPGDLPPVLDLEQTGGLAPADLASWTQAFLSRVRALTGRVPMVYSYPYFIKNSLGNTTQFSRYPLWLADYTGGSGPTYPLSGGWGNFTFWQFTSTASVPGISGNVDLSSYCCDSHALDLLSGRTTCYTSGNANTLAAGHPSVQIAAVGVDCALWIHPSTSSGFSTLGGILRGAPAVAASGQTTTPYYIVSGSDQDLYIRDGASSWQHLNTGGSAICLDSPAAVVSGNELWVACQGSDNALWVGHGAITSSALPQINRASWQSLGGTLTAGPAVAVVGANLTFFVTGIDRHLYHRTLSSGYAHEAYMCSGHPAAATFDATTHFACHGIDHALWYLTISSGGWSKAVSLGGVVVDGPAVAAGPSGPTFFVEGQDTAVWERTLTSAWSSDGGLVTYGVGAAWIQ